MHEMRPYASTTSRRRTIAGSHVPRETTSLDDASSGTAGHRSLPMSTPRTSPPEVPRGTGRARRPMSSASGGPAPTVRFPDVSSARSCPRATRDLPQRHVAPNAPAHVIGDATSDGQPMRGAAHQVARRSDASASWTDLTGPPPCSTWNRTTTCVNASATDALVSCLATSTRRAGVGAPGSPRPTRAADLDTSRVTWARAGSSARPEMPQQVPRGTCGPAQRKRVPRGTCPTTTRSGSTWNALAPPG